jgi:hypothetical protein
LVTGTLAALFVFIMGALWTGGGLSGSWPAVAAFFATFAYALTARSRQRAWGRGLLLDAVLAMAVPVVLAFPRDDVLNGDDEAAMAKGVAALVAVTISTLVGGLCLLVSPRSFYDR